MTFPNTRMLPALVAVAIAVAALSASACGSDEKPTGAGNDGASGKDAGARSVDRAFVAAMVAHNEAAIDMATVATRRGESASVRRLAGDIVAAQRREITALRREDRELAGKGLKRGSLGIPVTNSGIARNVAALKKAGAFDFTFLTLMIPHHQGAIAIARAELRKGADRQLKDLARRIRSDQRRQISAMREQLRNVTASQPNR
jgi:uncharacterized protein (DUF305 family)